MAKSVQLKQWVAQAGKVVKHLYLAARTQDPKYDSQLECRVHVLTLFSMGLLTNLVLWFAPIAQI